MAKVQGHCDLTSVLFSLTLSLTHTWKEFHSMWHKRQLGLMDELNLRIWGWTDMHVNCSLDGGSIQPWFCNSSFVIVFTRDRVYVHLVKITKYMPIVIFCICYISCSCTGWWRRRWSVFSRAGVIGRAAGLTKTDWDLQGTSDPHTLQLKTLKCDCTWITPERTVIAHAENTRDMYKAIYISKSLPRFHSKKDITKILCNVCVMCVWLCCFFFFFST